MRSVFPFFFLSLFLFASSFSIYAADEGFDIVVLLDESGSMMKTDRNNARGDATELFLRLCGPTHEVGLMGFSGAVRVLGEIQPMGPGPDRDSLIAKLKTIRSNGQWTHIELALRQALDELRRAKPKKQKRAVILMTDGKVDLGKGPGADLESVRNIRGPLAAEFLQENIAVYCVAFSSGADLELLEYLSEATHGLSVRGDREDELQQLFLRLFEEISSPQTAPLHDGKVLLDSSVREATFLISHSDSVPVRLTDPSDKVLSVDDANPQIKWFAAPRYDLITIAEPQPGEWNVTPKGKSDESRVIVLTDMELRLEDFEPSVKGGVTLRLLSHLFADEKTVQNTEIISRLRIEARLLTDEGTQVELFDDGTHRDDGPGDGMFGGLMETPQAAGFYDLEIIARAPTLERRIVRGISIAERWFTAETETEDLKPGEVLVVKIRVAQEIASKGENISFRATVQRPDGVRKNLTVGPVTNYLYTADFSDTEQTGEYRLTITGSLKGPKGQTIQTTVGPFLAEVAALHSSVALPPVQATPVPPQPPAPTPIPPAPTPPADSGSGSAPEWVWIVLTCGVIFIGVALIGAIIILLMRRIPSSTEPSMDDLRKRASDILQEDYDLPAPQSQPAAIPATAIKAKTKEPEPEKLQAPPAPEDNDHEERPTMVLPSEEFVSPDAEIIPEPDPQAPVSQVLMGGGVLIEKDAPEVQEPPAPEVQEPLAPEEPKAEAEPASMSTTETDLLAEIMGEIDDLPTEAPPRPSPEKAPEPAETPAETPAAVAPETPDGSLSQAENDLLADIMGEETPETPPEAPAPVAESGPGELTDMESDLLAEIMGTDEDSPAAAAEQAPAEKPPASDLTQTENDLLAEIMGETEETQPPEEKAENASDGTPTIPDGSDNKSDQEVIDDILNDIDGML